MKEFRKRTYTRAALCASLVQLIYSPIAYTVEEQQFSAAKEASHSLDTEELLAAQMQTGPTNTDDTYTINFNNVSVTQLIRFASKITNLNFIFEEADLQFSVTFVSKEAITPQSMMAALSQVLRVHDFVLLEQGDNVLITKSLTVKQIPPIVSSDLLDSQAGNAALVTRVFKIQNADVNILAGIIRPMVSAGALVEVSEATKQLIVTDIITNVDQIAILLTTLDARHTALEVDTYTVKNIHPEELITLTEQILKPFTEGNPLTFVPQPETNTIFIISTPYLVEQALSVMEDLDNPPKAVIVAEQGMTNKNIFVYKAVYKSPQELIEELKQIGKKIKSAGGPPTALESAIDHVQEIKDTGSLIFIANNATAEKLKSILATLDTPSASASKTSEVFVYKPQNTSAEQIQSALRSLIPALKEANTPSDNNLVRAIDALRWDADTQSFMVTADPGTIARLKSLFIAIDGPEVKTGSLAKGFFLYKLQHAKCETVLAELKNISKKIPPSSLQSQNLIAAIDHVECVPSNNSLLITGTNTAIEQIKTLIVEFDVSGPALMPMGAQSFLIYKPKHLPAQEVQGALTALGADLKASGLHDPQLFQALDSMRYVAQTQSLLFTGSEESLDKVQNLINGVDTSAALGAIQNIGNITFLLYKVQAASPEKLLSSLKTFAKDLKQSNVEDKELTQAINSVKWIRETNSLLFTGTQSALEKVDQLVRKFDLPSLTPQGISTATEREASTFVIYNPKYLSGDELISILDEFMQNLMDSGVADPALFDAINNLKWIGKTSSLLISGTPQAVEKVQQLLITFDIPQRESAAPSIESIDNTSFLVYKLQYHPGNDIQNALKQVATSLSKGSSSPAALVDAINSLQWIEVTNSLLCTGQQEILFRLKELIQSLDVPLRQVFIEVLVIETTLSNQQNFGLQWGGQVQYLNKTIMQTGNFPASIAQGSQLPTSSNPTFSQNLQTINGSTTPNNKLIPFSSGFDLGVIGDIIMHKGKSFISLGSLLNAIQLDGDSTIILNPKIITQDNRQSTVFVGQNIPYTGALVTNSSNSTVQNANIEYRDVGVSLTITPILGDGDVITMDIVQDISQVVNGTNVTISNTNLTGIQTNHTHMETRVHVPDNHFVALSGMINDTKTHFRTSIPCLGGLPVVGALFSENDRTASKNNVIIFVRPQIINTYQDYKAVTEHQEWLYKDNARLPVLKEEFDEGIDMVKLPENE